MFDIRSLKVICNLDEREMGILEKKSIQSIVWGHSLNKPKGLVQHPLKSSR